MVHGAEVLGSSRRTVRRALSLGCEVTSDYWRGALPLCTADISTAGVYLETREPLAVGDEVILSFAPPRWTRRRPMTLIAEVARAAWYRRSTDRQRTGMGLRFTDLDYDDLRALESSLRGLTPPLPALRRARSIARQWASAVVSWQEDLGDRINTFEVCEDVLAIREH